MRKQKIIIGTIISTIIFLIMILLSYFGFTRYILLYIKPPESFINNYLKLPKSGKKVITVINTTPTRLVRIKPTINSILDQTIKVEQIIIVLPQKYIDSKPKLPNYLSKIVIFIPSGKEYGSDISNSLIPVLLCERDNDTNIIILKDNIVYGQDFIETLLDIEKSNTDSVLKTEKNDGILVKPNYYDCESIKGKKIFDEKWLIGKAKNSKIVKYSDNFNSI